MAEADPDLALHESNRAARRLADAYLDFEDRNEELHESKFGTRLSLQRRKRAQEAHEELVEATKEYRRLRVRVLAVGEAHDPEDYPA